MNPLLVVLEHREGVIREISFELIGAALGLSEATGAEVIALVLAKDDGLMPSLEGRTPQARLIAAPSLEHYDLEAYCAALEEVTGELAPSLILTGHTSQGMDLAPALAGRLGLPIASDCCDLSCEGDRFLVSRQPYGGKLVEKLALKPAPTTVLTLQAGAFPEAPHGLETRMSRQSATPLAAEARRRFLGYAKAAVEDVEIADAEILVSVGRGIGSQENIQLAQELADTIGATLSCSRPVADAGWLPQSRQVGTSGKTVRPKLYIALGISGAFQHIAGMRGSDTILAVNKDPRAPIFGVASYGIVDDVISLLPALTKQFRD